MWGCDGTRRKPAKIAMSRILPQVNSRMPRRSIPLASGWVGLAASVVALSGGPRAIAEVIANVTRIDGSTVRGTWLGIDATGLRIQGVEGEAIPLDELESVGFREQAAVAGDELVHLWLADGGQLSADLLRTEGTSVVVNTPIGDSLSIPFERLAAIQLVTADQFPKAAEIFRASLADRPPGKDVLISRDVEDVKTVQGRLEAVDPTSGSFHFGDRVRSFQTEKMFGVVFARLAGDLAPAPVFLTLRDGARLSGEIVRADNSTVQLAARCCGEVVVSLDRLVRLDFRSNRVEYLSDLQPKSQKAEGRLHEPSSARMDQSVAAGPLMLDGKRYDRGLGVHSRTELTYALNGKYETFVSMIGIDDSARPLGSVTFQVVGDGQTLFEKTVTGRDAAELASVRVAGVEELTLIANYGDDVDLADLANWGGARLIKPRRR